MIIFAPANTDVVFDEKALNSLLNELGLEGSIQSIGPGDDPLLCFNAMLSIDNDSNVSVEVYTPTENKEFE